MKVETVLNELERLKWLTICTSCGYRYDVELTELQEFIALKRRELDVEKIKSGKAVMLKTKTQIGRTDKMKIEEVLAKPIGKYFAYHKTIGMPFVWTITHIPTGIALIKDADSERRVKFLASKPLSLIGTEIHEDSLASTEQDIASDAFSKDVKIYLRAKAWDNLTTFLEWLKKENTESAKKLVQVQKQIARAIKKKAKKKAKKKKG